MPDASCDNRWMNVQSLSQRHHRKRRRIVFCPAGLPDLLGNESVFRPLIRFIFPGVLVANFNIAQAEIVDKGVTFGIPQVATDMGKFVQQAKPKIIQTIMSKG